ncbi:hypothetical protein KUTeg_011675 [Tegillarca granosa]|uniref:WD repeat-containing protein 44 n=1 Tax=Tegillarca granosa TaxID=220873 RepID=A0ABQ9F2J7_TEGGR|nr:hypothetical protein KUTeg_011675 [Tegillarca granosa]
MSSDSELDEFYDAEDATPRQTFVNLKKIQENVNVSDKKLQELEKRRKKLADMRQRMFEDSADNGYQHPSDTDDEMLDDKDQAENDIDSDSSSVGGRKSTDKSTEHPVPPNSEKFSDLSENINSSLPEKVKPNKMIPELVMEDVSENASCLPESDSIVEDIIKETHVCSDDEPDIVKSTKTKTPPNTLAPQRPAATPPIVLSLPKAPPRRKKKEDRNSLEDDGQISSGTSTPGEWDTLSPGLPIPTPTSTVESLTKDLEFSLDLRSALGGGRHINAEDAERNAEILEAVFVKNLDTGEAVALSVAEEKIPSGINPLALHIMRRTKDDGSMTKDDVRRGEAKFKKLLGKILHSEETAVEEEVSCDGKVFKGAIWVMKFSHCGRLLATGGQDSTLRIWVVRSAYNYFELMKQKYADVRVSPAPSHESINTLISESSAGDTLNDADNDDSLAPFMAKPFWTYRGHSADLLDVSWSKNDFILSSSMDKTVRLWHISRRECLCTFQHLIFVITGKFAVAGTYDGKCIFYSTEQLKYYTQVHVRSTRGKNAQGRKITGIEPLLGEDKILVTSNDSRIRLYDLRDLTLSCKYKGCSNNSSQIKAMPKPIHNAVVTAAIFAPNPALLRPNEDEAAAPSKDISDDQGQIIISADFSGAIKVIQNQIKN